MTSEERPHVDVAVDASVILAAFFPDESSSQAHLLMENYALGRVTFWAPRLLILELLNACLVAKKRNRIDECVLNDLAAAIAALDVRWVDVEKNPLQMFSVSKQYSLTAYDAAYIVAAQMKGCKLVTGDLKMYEAVKKSLPFVVLLENAGEL